MSKLQEAINEAKKLNEGVYADVEQLFKRYGVAKTLGVITDHLEMLDKLSAADHVRKAADLA